MTGPGPGCNSTLVLNLEFGSVTTRGQASAHLFDLLDQPLFAVISFDLNWLRLVARPADQTDVRLRSVRAVRCHNNACFCDHRFTYPDFPIITQPAGYTLLSFGVCIPYRQRAQRWVAEIAPDSVRNVARFVFACWNQVQVTFVANESANGFGYVAVVADQSPRSDAAQLTDTTTFCSNVSQLFRKLHRPIIPQTRIASTRKCTPSPPNFLVTHVIL